MLFAIFLTITVLCNPSTAVKLKQLKRADSATRQKIEVTLARPVDDSTTTHNKDAIHPSALKPTSTSNDEDATIRGTSNIGLAGSMVTSDTMDTFRYLEEQDKDETKETIHIRTANVFFPVLLATVIVNVLTLVVLLIVIPILQSKKWSCFKSAFWVADTHLSRVTNISNRLLTNTKRPNETWAENSPLTTKQHAATTLANIFIPAFTCGAILATAIFLLIPEAVLLIQRSTSSSQTDEIELLRGTIARFGASLMAGFVFPMVLGAVFPRSGEHECGDKCVGCAELTGEDTKKRENTSRTVGMSEEEKDDEEKMINTDVSSESFEETVDTTRQSSTFDTPSALMSGSDTEGDNGNNVQKIDLSGSSNSKLQKIYSLNPSLAITILFGDATYNFFDGIFIGVAFLTCSPAIAVCVTLITVYNEISQHVADYFLLTKCAGVSIPRALLLIFLASIANVLGSMIIVGCNLGELAVGVLLAIAGGIYLHIAASECLPRVYALVDVTRDRLFALGFFIIGALPVGLTLLVEGHCTA